MDWTTECPARAAEPTQRSYPKMVLSVLAKPLLPNQSLPSPSVGRAFARAFAPEETLLLRRPFPNEDTA